jgi:hypothetical protein
MANPPYDHCPKCGLKSDRAWLNLYTGDYTGRAWGGHCKRHGQWAETSSCRPRPPEEAGA